MFLAARRVGHEPSPADKERETPSPADEALLRSTARRTWRFFEAFAGEEDHDLPPDNFQEDPRPVVAHRTSPTNIGLSLLSTVAAHDFGWIGAGEMTERLEATLSAMGKLERFRGHLYNWYDTRTLVPLEPRYISTVDSGNLAAHLIVLKQACLERAETETSPEVAFAGIGDALRLAEEAAAALPSASARTVPSRRELDVALSEVRSGLGPLGEGETMASRLSVLGKAAEVLVDVAGAVSAEQGKGAARDLAAWSESVRAAVASHLRDAGGGEGRRNGAGSRRSPRRLVTPSRWPRREARRGDGIRLPVRPDPEALLDRLPAVRTAASTPASTTSSPPRRG